MEGSKASLQLLSLKNQRKEEMRDRKIALPSLLLQNK